MEPQKLVIFSPPTSPAFHRSRSLHNPQPWPRTPRSASTAHRTGLTASRRRGPRPRLPKEPEAQSPGTDRPERIIIPRTVVASTHQHARREVLRLHPRPFIRAQAHDTSTTRQDALVAGPLHPSITARVHGSRLRRCSGSEVASDTLLRRRCSTVVRLQATLPRIRPGRHASLQGHHDLSSATHVSGRVSLKVVTSALDMSSQHRTSSLRRPFSSSSASSAFPCCERHHDR